MRTEFNYEDFLKNKNQVIAEFVKKWGFVEGDVVEWEDTWYGNTYKNLSIIRGVEYLHAKNKCRYIVSLYNEIKKDFEKRTKAIYTEKATKSIKLTNKPNTQP